MLEVVLSNISCKQTLPGCEIVLEKGNIKPETRELDLKQRFGRYLSHRCSSDTTFVILDPRSPDNLVDHARRSDAQARHGHHSIRYIMGGPARYALSEQDVENVLIDRKLAHLRCGLHTGHEELGRTVASWLAISSSAEFVASLVRSASGQALDEEAKPMGPTEQGRAMYVKQLEAMRELWPACVQCIPADVSDPQLVFERELANIPDVNLEPVIAEMYNTFSPHKDVTAILEKYKGCEPALLKALCDKYFKTLTEDCPVLLLLRQFLRPPPTSSMDNGSSSHSAFKRSIIDPDDNGGTCPERWSATMAKVE